MYLVWQQPRKVSHNAECKGRPMILMCLQHFLHICNLTIRKKIQGDIISKETYVLKNVTLSSFFI